MRLCSMYLRGFSGGLDSVDHLSALVQGGAGHAERVSDLDCHAQQFEKALVRAPHQCRNDDLRICVLTEKERAVRGDHVLVVAHFFLEGEVQIAAGLQIAQNHSADVLPQLCGLVVDGLVLGCELFQVHDVVSAILAGQHAADVAAVAFEVQREQLHDLDARLGQLFGERLAIMVWECAARAPEREARLC